MMKRLSQLPAPRGLFAPRTRLFFGRSSAAACLLACGVTAQTPDHAQASPEPAVESSGSFIDNIRRAGEYKRQYDEAREIYETSLAAYEAAWRELREIEEEILLHNATGDDFRELLRRERRAWGRLYRDPAEERPHRGETDKRTAGPKPLPPKFQLENVEEPREGVISRTIHRYRYWKNKYDTIRAMRDELEKHRAGLDPVLRERREELRRAREGSGDSRNLLQRELDAWSRLYRNSPNATPE